MHYGTSNSGIPLYVEEMNEDFPRIQRDVLNNSNFESAKEGMKTTSDYFEKKLNSN